MTRLLVTGMSGTGKSSVIRELARRGHEAVDTDSDEWCEWRSVSLGGGPPEPDWVWREDVMSALLRRERSAPLFVSGCKSNQGQFYPLFGAVVLLSAPTAVLLERIASRRPIPMAKQRVSADRSSAISRPSNRCYGRPAAWNSTRPA